MVAQAFDQLQIPYYVGGSLASSLHGIPRATQDADIVADIQTGHVQEIVSLLRTAFYIDTDMVRDAIGKRSSFNLIHLESMFKVDIFIIQRDETAKKAMARRETYHISPGLYQALSVASAEDTILHKLYWFRLGNRVSERQWDDVIGVLRVQKEALDLVYLRQTSREMDVSELLEQALSYTGIA